MLLRHHSLVSGAAARPARGRTTAAIVCNSTGSSGNAPSSARARKNGKKGVSSTTTSGSSSTPSVAAAATVTTVEEVVVAAPPAAEEGITLANPPLGFANNIVPSRPLVVTPSPPGSSSSSGPVDSSDEELDQSSPSQPVGGGTGRSSAWRCLVLDSRYLPVNVVAWGRAVSMDMSGKVDVLEYHPGGYAYSAYKAHPLPAVLRVHTFVDVHEFAGRLPLTRKNIMLRDHHRCQYCGSTRELTLDHVTPVCRGGLNSWQNLVTACMACNQRKGDKSLQQLGWKLPGVPREPTPGEVGVVAGVSKNDLEHPPLPWVPYLATFKEALEKAQRRSAAAVAAASGSSGSSSSDSAFAGEQLLAGSSSGGQRAGAAKLAVAAKASSSINKAPKRMRH